MLAQKDLRKLKYHWDNKLSASSWNQWPLAPSDLVQMGKVSYGNYYLENARLTMFCTNHMLSELKVIQQCTKLRTVSTPRIEILGPGLGSRDLRWLGTAMSNGFDFNVRDISSVAMKNINLLFRSFINEGRVRIIIGDIEQTMKKVKVNPRKTIAYFGSQFFQVLSRRKMRNTLAQLGVVLNQWPKGVTPKPRIYIIHPLPEDNQGSRVWNGIKLVRVQWGDTIPYSMNELTEALESKLGGRKVIPELLGKDTYYHQCYSLIRFSLLDS